MPELPSQNVLQPVRETTSPDCVLDYSYSVFPFKEISLDTTETDYATLGIILNAYVVCLALFVASEDAHKCAD